MLPTEVEMSEMRREAGRVLTNMAEILSPETVIDNAGSETLVWRVSGNYPACFGSERAVNRVVGGKDVYRQEITIRLPYNAAVSDTDRVRIMGITYEIAEIVKKSRRILTNLSCVRI